MFELTYRNKKVTELTDIQSQKVHTGGTKFAKKNKHTCTPIRDTRVLIKESTNLQPICIKRP